MDDAEIHDYFRTRVSYWVSLLKKNPEDAFGFYEASPLDVQEFLSKEAIKFDASTDVMAAAIARAYADWLRAENNSLSEDLEKTSKKLGIK